MTGILAAQWVGLNFVIEMQDEQGETVQRLSLSAYEWEQIKEAGDDELVVCLTHKQDDSRPSNALNAQTARKSQERLNELEYGTNLASPCEWSQKGKTMRIHVCDDPEKHVLEREDCFELTVTPATVDVLLERERQDSQWGGPDHDDQHEPTDWLRFIHKQEERAKDLDAWPRRASATYRERLVKIAALAIAAIESYDRKVPAADHDNPSEAKEKPC